MSISNLTILDLFYTTFPYLIGREGIETRISHKFLIFTKGEAIFKYNLDTFRRYIKSPIKTIRFSKGVINRLRLSGNKADLRLREDVLRIQQ